VSFLLVAGCTAALAVASGYLAARRARVVAGPVAVPPRPAAPPDAPPPRTDLGVSLELGHVVTLRGVGQALDAAPERWLEGGIVLAEEQVPLAVVFFAPEGGKQVAVVSYPPPDSDIVWGDIVELELGSEPPTTLEVEGVVLSRVRRHFVSARRVGSSAPRVGDRVTCAVYESTGDLVLVAIVAEAPLCVFGRRLSKDEYESWGSGEERAP
jgi:hypothetical protein